MKKNLILALLCVFSSQLSAQRISFDLTADEKQEEKVSPIVQQKIETYATEIREIVIDEKLAMKKEIEKIDQDLSQGNLTEEEADNLKADTALRFSERINSSIQGLKFDLDEIVKQQVKYSILNTDIETLQKQKHIQVDKTRVVNTITGYMAYGIMNLPKGNDADLNQHIGFASGIDAGFIYNRQLSQTSPLVFKSGFYFSWRTLHFEDDRYIARDEQGNIRLAHHAAGLSKSKLRATYLIVPLGLKYNFSKLITTSEGETYRKVDNGLGIAANIYGGFKISNNNIVKGDNINSRKRKTDFGMNDLTYGGQLTLSYKLLNFYVRQDFSAYFDDKTFDDRKMLQVGINIGF